MLPAIFTKDVCEGAGNDIGISFEKGAERRWLKCILAALIEGIEGGVKRAMLNGSFRQRRLGQQERKVMRQKINVRDGRAAR